MMTAPILNLIRESAEAVLVITDDVTQAELLRSRLTREEVRRQLLTLAMALSGLPVAARQRMPEIDWAGWQSVERNLATPGSVHEETLWTAAKALTPETLSWLRVYRQSHPDLFKAWI